MEELKPVLKELHGHNFFRCAPDWRPITLSESFAKIELHFPEAAIVPVRESQFGFLLLELCDFLSQLVFVQDSFSGQSRVQAGVRTLI